jgi:hypothetical protein
MRCDHRGRSGICRQGPLASRSRCPTGIDRGAGGGGRSRRLGSESACSGATCRPDHGGRRPSRPGGPRPARSGGAAGASRGSRGGVRGRRARATRGRPRGPRPARGGRRHHRQWQERVAHLLGAGTGRPVPALLLGIPARGFQGRCSLRATRRAPAHRGHHHGSGCGRGHARTDQPSRRGALPRAHPR